MAMMNEGRIEGRDGLGLFYRICSPGEPKAVLAIIHGMAEHSGRYTELMQRFASKGYASYALDLRGLGKSEGVRGHVDRFDDFVDDVVALLEQAKRDYPARPVFLVGHSMGGLIVLRLGMRYPGLCDGIVASSPGLGVAMEVPGWKKSLARVMLRLAPRMAIDNGIRGEDVLRDPAAKAAYDKDPLRYGKVTARFYAQFMQGMSDTVRRAEELNYPVLIMQAGSDRVVSRQAVQQFYERVASADKTFRLFDHMYHEIFNDPEREAVYQHMEKWLEKRVAGGE